MARGARVLREAPVPLRPGRLPDLERIFASTVVVTDAITTDPATLLEVAGSVAIDAVGLDVVAPAAMPQLIDALAAYQLLRPTWVETRPSRGEGNPGSPATDSSSVMGRCGPSRMASSPLATEPSISQAIAPATR